jgi:hypothetical protein
VALDDLNLSLAVTRVCFLIIGDGILVILVLKANLSGIKSKSYLPKKTKAIPPSLKLMTYVIKQGKKWLIGIRKVHGKGPLANNTALSLSDQ